MEDSNLLNICSAYLKNRYLTRVYKVQIFVKSLTSNFLSRYCEDISKEGLSFMGLTPEFFCQIDLICAA